MRGATVVAYLAEFMPNETQRYKLLKSIRNCI